LELFPIILIRNKGQRVKFIHHSPWFLSSPPTMPLTLARAVGVVVLLALSPLLPQARVTPEFHPHALSDYKYQNNVQTPAFSLRFRCSSAPEFCKKAERAFSRAAERILSEFRIRRTIVVDLAMFQPCNQKNPDPATCPEAKILGFAAPLQRVPVRHRDDNQIYLYPTSLLKQTDIEGVEHITWPEIDITSKFNAAYRWYFAEDGVPINDTQRDLELVATHEFLHGLGYGDDFLMTYRPDKNATQLIPHTNTFPGLIMPPSSDMMALPPFNGPAITQFSGPTIWNRFTYLSGKYLVEHYYTLRDAFNRLKLAGTFTPFQGDPRTGLAPLPGQFSIASVVYGLRNDTVARPLMEQLYKEGTTANTLEFRCGSWPPESPIRSIQTLETSINPFSDGSTASHVAIAANSTSDFIMVFSTGARSFSTLIANNKAPASGIGAPTKDILLALGYPSATGDGASRRHMASVDPSARTQSDASYRSTPSVLVLVSLYFFYFTVLAS
jgi:hypothetical protein